MKKNPNIMFGENEKFLDPGKRYENKLNRKSEKDKNPNQFQTDQYLGDFRNNGKFVQIALRDHESPDGDLIRIMLNDKEVVSRVLLRSDSKYCNRPCYGFQQNRFCCIKPGRVRVQTLLRSWCLMIMEN